jgi:desulfoferrodoxin (superoxide reductase-like protein)
MEQNRFENSLSRRDFIKGIAVGGAAIAATTVTAPTALAADTPQDIKFAQDPKNLKPGLEVAHTAAISLEKVDARDVAYGKTPAGEFYRVAITTRHESTKEHHIFDIALYINGLPVARHQMSQALAESSLPSVVFFQRLKTGDELLVVTDCNLHGKWGSRLTV